MQKKSPAEPRILIFQVEHAKPQTTEGNTDDDDKDRTVRLMKNQQRSVL